MFLFRRLFSKMSIIEPSPPHPQIPGFHYATFAGGCFWGMQKYFQDEFPSIRNLVVGYTGGSTLHPTYEQTCSGKTGHAESILFEFDPTKIRFHDLCLFFYRIHDPTTLNAQGNDRGTQYRSAIFYHSDEQKEVAEAVTKEVQQKYYPTRPIVTTFEKASTFWIAEPYHQEYLKMNPGGYCNHRKRW